MMNFWNKTKEDEPKKEVPLEQTDSEVPPDEEIVDEEVTENEEDEYDIPETDLTVSALKLQMAQIQAQLATLTGKEPAPTPTPKVTFAGTELEEYESLFESYSTGREEVLKSKLTAEFEKRFEQRLTQTREEIEGKVAVEMFFGANQELGNTKMRTAVMKIAQSFVETSPDITVTEALYKAKEQLQEYRRPKKTQRTNKVPADVDPKNGVKSTTPLTLAERVFGGQK